MCRSIFRGGLQHHLAAKYVSCLLKKRKQLGSVEIPIVDVGPDLNPRHPQLFNTTPKLATSHFGILQRHR